MTRRRVFGAAIAAVFLVTVFAGGWLAGRLGIGSVVAPESLSDLERDFAGRMRDVSLIGSFTVAGREDRAPREDRYDIASVEKVGDSLWRFNVGMSCCGLDGAEVPIVVPMTWAGDTPMIMMTDTGLPGIGTFTARVFFYGDRYAGTWQGGPAGGLMFGRIEPRGADAADPPADNP